MKKIFSLLITAYFFGSISAQGSVSMPTTEAFFEKIFIDGINQPMNYSDINGSAYVNADFKKAKVSDNYESILARYNSYKDQVEFKKDNQIFVLDKSNLFSRISFSNNENLVLLNLNGTQGYFYELYSDDKKVLLKKIKTILNIPAKSKNSYTTDDSSPSFVTTTDYYLGMEGKFYQIPNKTKKIYELFPERKKDLEILVKSKKLNLNEEYGLIEFIKLL